MLFSFFFWLSRRMFRPTETMFSLQVVEQQVKNNKTNFVLVFRNKARITACFFRDLLITRAAYRAGHNIKSVTGILVNSRTQGVRMTLHQMAVYFRALTAKRAIGTLEHWLTRYLELLLLLQALLH